MSARLVTLHDFCAQLAIRSIEPARAEKTMARIVSKEEMHGYAKDLQVSLFLLYYYYHYYYGTVHMMIIVLHGLD